MIPIITIEGATATGKSALAIDLAQALDTEIISADSRQVYRGMDIGTAKVSAADQEKVKHHLIDIVDPDASYNAGIFVIDANNVITNLRERGKIPIVCGGTGLYVSSLIHGLCPLPTIDPQIKTELIHRLECEGLDNLYQELMKIDPVVATNISSNDPQRTLRALEVFYGTGNPLSWHWTNQERQCRYNCLRIQLQLSREELYARIEFRLGMMLKDGLLDEIGNLLANGYGAQTPGMKCLGYKEFIPYIHGLIPLETAISLAAQHQRNLAKRQLTWYRKHSFDLTLDSRSFKLSDIITILKDFIVEE